MKVLSLRGGLYRQARDKISAIYLRRGKKIADTIPYVNQIYIYTFITKQDLVYKKIYLLLAIYLVQLLASSCRPCNCPEVATFEKTYTGLELKVWDTSGFQSSESIGPFYKNAFGLSTSINFDLTEVVQNIEKDIDINGATFGFSSAYACDCPFIDHIETDPIVSLDIIAIDLQSEEEEIYVTENFVSHNSNGTQVSIAELIENRAVWHDGFQFELNDFDNIPLNSIFKIVVTLSSGNELIELTDEVEFID